MDTGANQELAVAIHYLHPWGGQEQSTLEIARRLSRTYPLGVYSFDWQDPEHRSSWGKAKWHRPRVHIARPQITRVLIYYAYAFWWFGIYPALRRKRRPIVHATGTCSPLSDVVQVQFVHSEWNRLRHRMGATSGPLRRVYHEVLMRFDVWLEKKIYRPNKTYVAISNGVARELQEHFGIQKNVHVIYHGVDSERFRPVVSPDDQKRRDEIRQTLGIGADEIVLILVGAYERKGLATTIQALGRLKPETLKKVKLLAVGSGDRVAYERLAREQGVADRLLMVANQRNVDDYYRAADVFILPTLYEPFGLVILEALASGLPSIVSRRAGAAELIEDGLSGILIDDPLRSDESVRAIEKLVDSRELRQSMSMRARRLAEQYSWDRVASDYLKILGDLKCPAEE